MQGFILGERTQGLLVRPSSPIRTKIFAQPIRIHLPTFSQRYKVGPGPVDDGYNIMPIIEPTNVVRIIDVMPFRFQARYALLTYAQCGELDPHAVDSLLTSLGGKCIVGRENHADEGIHLHAFVDFGVKFRTYDQRCFDVDGCHPNVSPSRGTPAKGYDYAIKDGEIVAGELERPDGGRVSSSSIDWGRIADAESVLEFWRLARELAPRALLTNYQSLRAYADWHYRPERDAYGTPEGISFTLERAPELAQWVHDYVSGSTVSK